MSKAFTKAMLRRPRPIRRDAAQRPAQLYHAGRPDRLQDELKHLRAVEQPKVVEIVSWAAGNGDRSENGDYIYGKKRLREIDRRLRHLMKRIECAKVVDPRRQSQHHREYFGAQETYVTGAGARRRVRIVGVDEVRHEQGEISWVAPIARALMRAEVGDVVEVRAPGGVETLEIEAIDYA